MSPNRQTTIHRRPTATYGEMRARAVATVLLLGVGIACAGTVERPDNQTRSGAMAADNGYWEEASFRWQKALAVASVNTRALNNLAVRHEREGEFDDAKDYYDQALELAGPDERFYVLRNHRQFLPIWERIDSDEMVDAEAIAEELAAEDPTGVVSQEYEGAEPTLGFLEIMISVPDQGPNLAGYNRILVGNFVRRDDSEANLNDMAVRYLRRRITQRTFFETQDQLEQPIDRAQRGTGILDDADYWVGRAEAAEADLVLTGAIGLISEPRSEMVRERIRSPDGQIREVARFQDNVAYKLTYDYLVLRGEDGSRLLDGTLEAETSFPADESVSNSDAVFETFEQLLPQLLDAITPRRSEQSRYLIY